MEADHITPWHEGGKTDAGDYQMLCKEDNRQNWEVVNLERSLSCIDTMMCREK